MGKTLSVLVVGADTEARDACASLLRKARLRPYLVDPHAPDLRVRSGPTAPDICVVVCTHLHTATHEVELYRDVWASTPLLVVDASPGSFLAVPLLDAGADDVVAPAQAPLQLVPRVRALVRRALLSRAPAGQVRLTAGSLQLDIGALKAWSRGTELAFSPTEFRILQALCTHAGRVVPHRELLTAAWGEVGPEMAEALRVYIRHIRRKVQEAGEAVTIVTRPGIGYALVSNE